MQKAKNESNTASRTEINALWMSSNVIKVGQRIGNWKYDIKQF